MNKIFIILYSNKSELKKIYINPSEKINNGSIREYTTYRVFDHFDNWL